LAPSGWREDGSGQAAFARGTVQCSYFFAIWVLKIWVLKIWVLKIWVLKIWVLKIWVQHQPRLELFI
jgi:hypothetical protein